VITSLLLAVSSSVIKAAHMALAAPKTKRFLFLFWGASYERQGTKACMLLLLMLLLLLILLLMSDLQHASISSVIGQTRWPHSLPLVLQQQNKKIDGRF
jgi:ABC-type Fe3+-siderophore transport system permease subunit